MLLVGRGWLLDNPEPLLLSLRPTCLLYNSCVPPRVSCCDGNKTNQVFWNSLDTIEEFRARCVCSIKVTLLSRIRQVWMTTPVLLESWMRRCLSFNYPNCKNVPQTQSKERTRKHLQQKQDGSGPLTLPENRSVSSLPKGPFSWSALLSERHINVLWSWQAVKGSTNPSLTFFKIPQIQKGCAIMPKASGMRSWGTGREFHFNFPKQHTLSEVKAR